MEKWTNHKPISTDDSALDKFFSYEVSEDEVYPNKSDNLCSSAVDGGSRCQMLIYWQVGSTVMG